MNYKYSIGENVWVYTSDDDFEYTTVYDRQRRGDFNYYLVDWGWEREPYLRKHEKTHSTFSIVG